MCCCTNNFVIQTCCYGRKSYCSSSSTCKNYVLACRSKVKLWRMIKERVTLDVKDVIVFCRPDVTFVDRFDTGLIRRCSGKKSTIWCPSWGTTQKVNDRMAVCSPMVAPFFATYPMHSLHHRLCATSESLLSLIFQQNGILVQHFDEFFFRTRCGGILEPTDIRLEKTLREKLERRRKFGLSNRCRE